MLKPAIRNDIHALRKCFGDIWWCGNAYAKPIFPWDYSSAWNSFRISEVWKMASWRIHACVEIKKKAKNQGTSVNEGRRHGEQHTLKHQHTCSIPCSQLLGWFGDFLKAKMCMKQFCGRNEPVVWKWNTENEDERTQIKVKRNHSKFEGETMKIEAEVRLLSHQAPLIN